MKSNHEVFILGPDDAYNGRLGAGLTKIGLKPTFLGNGIDELRAAAQRPAPEIVLLNSQLIEGWSFDLINALVILFPKSSILVTGEGLQVNAHALKNLKVDCYINRTLSLEEMVAHIEDCRLHSPKRKNFQVS